MAWRRRCGSEPERFRHAKKAATVFYLAAFIAFVRIDPVIDYPTRLDRAARKQAGVVSRSRMVPDKNRWRHLNNDA
jgi:hypothetical protein